MATYPWSHEGRYDDSQLIAEGGMGAVYRARDANLGRMVAIKVIRSVLADDSAYCKRMRREIEALSKLEHPNIVRLYECNSGPSGELYFTMEYVEGADFSDYLKLKKLSTEKTVKLFLGVLEAVSALHERQIIHRDIKAANVLVTEGGIAKLIDLGLARVNDATPLTGKNQVVGTIAYLPPEVSRGEPYTIACDVYQLGFMLEIAFHANDARKKDELLREIIDKAMRRNPSDRYQSVIEFKKALSKWLRASPSGRAKSAARIRIEKKPKRSVLPLVAFALLIISALFLWFQQPKGADFTLLNARLKSPTNLIIMYKGTAKGALTVHVGPGKGVNADLKRAKSLPGGQYAIEVALPKAVVGLAKVTLLIGGKKSQTKVDGTSLTRRLLQRMNEIVEKDNNNLTTRLGHLSFAFSQQRNSISAKRIRMEKDMYEVFDEEGLTTELIKQLKECIPAYVGQDVSIFEERFLHCLPLMKIETVLAVANSVKPPWGLISTKTGVSHYLAPQSTPLHEWRKIWGKKISRKLHGGELWYWLSPPVAKRLAVANLQTISAAANIGSQVDTSQLFNQNDWLPDENSIFHELELDIGMVDKAEKYALLLELKFFHRSGIILIHLGNGKKGYLFNNSAWTLPPTNFVYRRHMNWHIPISREELEGSNIITLKLKRIENFGTLPILAIRNVELLAAK